MGLACSFGLSALISGCLPLVLAKVAGDVFGGAAPATPQQMAQNPALLNAGPKINDIILICLLIPAVMSRSAVCARTAAPST